ncbi:NUDIX domain-containing protein [Herbiconiux sp. CPCC 205716]|uniref:NUDIX domain-containing protein n=1 Tax=Herbiconiux gentiana TaxID=2970912 RepID=A0ABT2GCP6_9MICO|nr:NUDIX domain-containing protein [Herbiconiux gentiana]MCS5713994.1 NUDIX domain-containing protein [Herbiconiux gentiana]
MPTPDFVLSLREKIGHEQLWLTGVTAVVLRAASGQDARADVPGSVADVLLVRRSDNGAWTPVTGIIDPGEEPAVAGAREVLEEADVVAEPVSLAWVHTLPEVVYDNGDRTLYLDLCFLFRYVSGEPFPADGENTEAAWFPLDALPVMSTEMRARIDAAVAGEAAARFEF